MKKLYANFIKCMLLSAIFALLTVHAIAQSLTLGAVDAGPYTPGSSIAVPFSVNTSSGCIKPDNVFNLYISSVPNGTPNTLIGSFNGFYATFVNGTIPTGLADGSYNLAIQSTMAPATSPIATINIVAGNPVEAKLNSTVINSSYPDVFGNCSGNGTTYSFTNNSTNGATVTTDVFDEINQTDKGALTFNAAQSATFNAAKVNYTIFVKATYNGVEGTRAYQLVNNRLTTNFGTTSGDPVCLINGQGVLMYTILPAAIQNNYPGDLYTVDWGDGTFSQYTLCDLLLTNGQLSHSYLRSSCSTSSGGQINSFPVNAQASSNICGTLGSPLTSYAKVVSQPVNSFTGPLSACLNVPVTFYNNSDPGQDASNANCQNTNALYTWIIDKGTANEVQFTGYALSAPFTYTFTTSGHHTVTLRYESQSNTVCSATDLDKDFCVLQPPRPNFTLTAATICSSDVVTPNDHSYTDNSCSSIPANNAYTWSVTGPAGVSYLNNTTAASHQPDIKFTTPGVYTLTLSIGTETCGAVSTSQTITVNSPPTVTLSADQQYCGTNRSLTFSAAAGATQTIFTGTTADQPDTYSWTVSGGPYSYLNGTGANSKYPQILFSGYGVYTVTAMQTNNCNSASDSQQLDFKQSPVVNAGQDQTICPADNVQLAGTITGPAPQSYVWSGGGGTFSPDRNTLNAVYTPSNAEINAGSVSLALVAITGYNAPCDQVSDDITITINPRNAVTSSSTKNICTGTAVAYQPTAQVNGSTFTWTSSASPTVSGNSASGSGAINDMLANSDPNNAGTVVYTITPHDNTPNNCPGSPFTLTVTVTPRPVITVNQTSNTICSGQRTGITFTSNIPNSLFKWTSNATPGIYGANNQTPVVASRVDDLLENGSTTASGTVTYVITPIGPSGCEGNPVTVVITVQPLPVPANAGPDAQLCAETTYTLQGNDPGISSGNWSVVSGPGGAVFANASRYNTTVSGLQPGQQYTFRWTITGSSQCAVTSDDVTVNDLADLTNTISYGSSAACYGQTVTVLGSQPTGGTNSYTYVWETSSDNVGWNVINGQSSQNLPVTLTASAYFRRTVSSGPCVKISNTVYILVQPPISSNSISQDQQICYNNTPTQLNGSTPAGADGNFFYQWQQSTDNGANWSNIGSATTINYQPVALTATTLYRRIVTTALCSGDQQNTSNTITITVVPQNTNTLTSASSLSICTGAVLNYHPTASQSNTVFNWVSSATANVNGNAASGSGDINNILTNTDPNNNGTVTYTITPANNDCPGNPFTLTVTVTPLPVITLNRNTNTICSGQSSGITFTSNLPGTLFKWTSTATADAHGNTNQATIITDHISDVLTNSSTTVNATVTYTITPTSASGCEGVPANVTITIQPISIPADAGPDKQLCAESSYQLQGNDPGIATGLWTITSGQGGVGFTDATRYNATVNGLQAGQLYTFKWTITGPGACTVSSDEVNINDLLDLTNTLSFPSSAVCSGETITVFGDQPTGGSNNYTYSWESSTDNISWTAIAGQVGQNLTFTPQQSLYIHRIVTAAPCVNTSSPVFINVKPPLSNNTISADQHICYNNPPAGLTGSVPTGAEGNYIFQWQQSTDNGNNWTDIAGTHTQNYQPGTLQTTTLFRRVVTSAVCYGDQSSNSNVVTITVDPQNTNTITSASAATICTGATFAYHPTASQPNTVFTWVSSASGSVSGNTASGSGDINDVLRNADLNNNGSVVYTITPINGNCPAQPFVLTVTVAPLPFITFSSNNTTICSGLPTGIAFSTNMPNVMVKWTSDDVQGINGNNDQNPVIATRIDDILTSDLKTQATIVYHLTPISAEGCVGATVDATVNVLSQPVQPNAGPDAVVCSVTSYNLHGNNPNPSTGKWTVTSGQTGVGFADDTRYNTTANGLIPGQNYTFRWTITSAGNCSSVFDEVTINDLAPVVNKISYSAPAVCYGQTVTITGDPITGGNGTYAYKWESSIDNLSWEIINSANAADYSFTGTKNIYLRRTVTSGPCTDVSTPVYITVQPAITNNTVASDQEICYNNAPKMLTGSLPAGADGNYAYQWQNSTDDGASWSNINGATDVNYQVNNLTQTTTYRRIVTSALCNGVQQSISNIIKVLVNPLPVATYTFTNDKGCVPFVIDAKNIVPTGGEGNNSYAWFADGILIGTGQNFPGYKIIQDSTSVKIKLIVSSKFGCSDASFSHIFSSYKEVTANFEQDLNKGCGPLKVTFTNTSNPLNAASYVWDFGNGTVSTEVNPNPVTFLPRTNGKDTTYIITLKANTVCGVRTYKSTVLVRPQPISIFSPDQTVGCSPFIVHFTNTSPGTGNTYTYDFGDGQTFVTDNKSAVSHTYTSTSAKTFTVKMTVRNECGISTTQYILRISPNSVLPELVVDGDQKAGCAPWTVQFHNNTRGANYFTYDFGDGTTLNTLNAPEVITHTFLKGGIYKVKLSATNGCSDTAAYQSITVYDQPVTKFTSDVQTACGNLTVNFKNQTAGSNSYFWNFGDGSTSTLANPSHLFIAQSKAYTVSLIAVNQLGCADTLVMKDYIALKVPPKAAFSVKPDSVIVYPNYQFGFSDKTTGSPVLWKWTFGDGSSSAKQNPEHTYRDTGIYEVKLVVYGLYGCVDSVKHRVRITGVPGQVFVPNAFMPASRYSEVTSFFVKGSGMKTWRFRVFNKWGQVIWQSTKLTEKGEPVEGWDGMMNGQPAPQGVYFWQIDATFVNGTEWKGMSYNGSAPSKTGVIHLIR